MTDEAELIAFLMFLILLVCQLVGIINSWLLVFLPYLIKLFLVLAFFAGALIIGGDE